MQNGNIKLPDLPPSNHKWWSKAIKYRTEFVNKPKCEHYFEHKSAREVVCKNCNIGYYLSNEKVINGQFVI